MSISRATRAVLAVSATMLVLSYSALALGGFDTGNDFLANCTDQSAFRQGHCAGYVAAVADTLPAISEGYGTPCIPASASLKQLMDISLQYVEDQPALRHHAAASLIFEAIKAAFPCQ